MKLAFTPMMQQYLQIKEQYKDCILFFRLGDFYEMFFEDAEIASRELELVLTGRECGLEEKAPMCGLPYHAANSYIGRLINRGYKVAICEQVEDPALAKGIVKRDVIKIITPGTYNDGNFIDENKNNYVMSIYINKKLNNISLSFSDISTGEFYSTFFYYDEELIFNEISKFAPSEIIVQRDISDELLNKINSYLQVTITKKQEDYFKTDAKDILLKNFQNIDFDKKNESIIFSSSALLKYILETQKTTLTNINNIEFYDIIDNMAIDINTRRNLELTESLREKSKKGSLLWVMDKTATAMGSRMIRKWIEQPLISKKAIQKRLDSVEEIYTNISLMQDIQCNLKEVYDIERILGKIALKSVNAKELISLKMSIKKLPGLKNLLSKFNSDLLKEIYDDMDELKDIYELLEVSIEDNPSMSVKEGNIIKDGYNTEVDELRRAKLHGKEWIASLESSEREITGIKSLKVGYNKVFGYYIEISKANYSSIPEGRYIRKQTLANAERFITQELKEMEDKILGAEEKLINLEYQLFVDIRDKVENEIDRMKKSAKLISEIDCLTSLAVVALENNYIKPIINEEDYIRIEEGRHPVVEKMMERGEFVSNNTYIDNKEEQLILITGPNMAGKSTYMRQVALICLMAQIGSFVPAKSAELCVCDKIFTRIGASDDLAGGKSTFMVEMWEVANILNNATEKSLVLLDEVGRGTSTYDGLSIAWAVIEYICQKDNLRCKTLFATHYHELTMLEDKIEGVKNYSVAVKEINNSIVFLRKIVKGGADQSYGIEVAKLAGLPKELIERAKEILKKLEEDSNPISFKEKHSSYKEIAAESDLDAFKKEYIKENKSSKQEYSKEAVQIDFASIEKENFIKDISNIDIMNMTPMDSMNKLYEIVSRVKKLC